jgi:hypothetical protein
MVTRAPLRRPSGQLKVEVPAAPKGALYAPPPGLLSPPFAPSQAERSPSARRVTPRQAPPACRPGRCRGSGRAWRKASQRARAQPTTARRAPPQTSRRRRPRQARGPRRRPLRRPEGTPQTAARLDEGRPRQGGFGGSAERAGARCGSSLAGHQWTWGARSRAALLRPARPSPPPPPPMAPCGPPPPASPPAPPPRTDGGAGQVPRLRGAGLDVDLRDRVAHVGGPHRGQRVCIAVRPPAVRRVDGRELAEVIGTGGVAHDRRRRGLAGDGRGRGGDGERRARGGA